MLALLLALATLSQGIVIEPPALSGGSPALSLDICHPVQGLDRAPALATLARPAPLTLLPDMNSTLAGEIVPRAQGRLASPPATPPPEVLA